ncbi:MAG: 4Fe-4S binding protein [Lentisphaerae bacterium]|nr:4Fe-4S binding protein [Lentisphaerota bacterium]
MAIPTSRSKVEAEIRIDTGRCTGCGRCVSVCKSFCLVLKDHKVALSGTSLFGCIGCGHCMAICPAEAITIQGRELSPDDLYDSPPPEDAATYPQLTALLQRRRSIREYEDRPVEAPLIEAILNAAQTAPMGLPPSDVNVVVFDSLEKSRAFAQDYVTFLKGLRFMTSKFFLAMMRPFWGKSNDELFRGFVSPLFSMVIDDMEKGKNDITYDAPVLFYFYGSPYADPADALVAATYAMLAAESIGLGTCMLGAIHPLIQYGAKAKKLREKYGIVCKSREGLFLAVGYPALNYKKSLKRTFASIHYQ